MTTFLFILDFHVFGNGGLFYWKGVWVLLATPLLLVLGGVDLSPTAAQWNIAFEQYLCRM
jgi:hypothetical protein